ncbi:hypothetical protein ACHAQJ_000543 [Trichoderma viride]
MEFSLSLFKAEGKDAEEQSQSSSMVSRDIVAPCVRDGILQYTIAQLAAPSESGESWALRGESNGIVDDDESPQALSVTSGGMPSSHPMDALWQ